MSSEMERALSDQLNAELYSFYLYLAVANWYRSQGLDGFAHWMEAQAQEELGHALKIYHHLHQRGGVPVLGALEAPPASWDSPLAALEAVADHERQITRRVTQLADLAVREKDHASRILADWFVTEQVEEEATVGDLVRKARMLATTPNGIYLLDRELAQRPAES